MRHPLQRWILLEMKLEVSLVRKQKKELNFPSQEKFLLYNII